MTIETIERDFKTKVCEKIRLWGEGVDRFRVFTPFLFEDGDHLGRAGIDRQGARRVSPFLPPSIEVSGGAFQIDPGLPQADSQLYELAPTRIALEDAVGLVD